MILDRAITLEYADQQRVCKNRNKRKCFDQRRLEAREDSVGRSEWQKQQDWCERQSEEVISDVDARYRVTARSVTVAPEAALPTLRTVAVEPDWA